jgi:hypothetical protein
MVSGKQRRIIVGAYIPPSEEDVSTIEFIQVVIKENELPLILLGDLNMDLKREIKESENN